MNKSLVARTVGFVAALGTSVALVGAAVSTTGAYFTDSHDGTIRSGTGTVRVNTSDLLLDFAGLLPGEPQTKRVDYQATGSGSEDIWLVFPDGQANAFIQEAQSGPTPLGRYGHLRITSTGGATFVSNNLAKSHGGYEAADSCYTNNEGWGGSEDEAASLSAPAPKYCAPRNAILLQSGMTYGQTGYANIEFGFTKLLTAPQGADLAPLAKFKIVATQHGVRPDDPNN